MISTVRGSIAFTSVICLAIELTLEATAGSRWRFSENTTSAEDSVLPLWKVTPLRSLTVQTLASLLSMLSASSICGVPLLSRNVRRL